MVKVKLMFDGACDNNAPIPMMGIGVAVWIDGIRAMTLDRYAACGQGTNNIAEYLALTMALEIAKELDKPRGQVHFDIYGDSQLVIYQMTNKWEVKAGHLKGYHAEAKLLRGTIQSTVYYHWVKRELNTEADRLSKVAVKEYFEKIMPK